MILLVSLIYIFSVNSLSLVFCGIFLTIIFIITLVYGYLTSTVSVLAALWAVFLLYFLPGSLFPVDRSGVNLKPKVTLTDHAFIVFTRNIVSAKWTEAEANTDQPWEEQCGLVRNSLATAAKVDKPQPPQNRHRTEIQARFLRQWHRSAFAAIANYGSPPTPSVISSCS